MPAYGVGDAGLERRYYSEGDTAAIEVPPGAAMFAVEMRAALTQAKEGMGCSADRWGIEDAAGRWAMVVGFNSDYGSLTDRRGLRVYYGHKDRSGQRVATDSVDLYDGVNALRGFNTLAMEWNSGEGGRLDIFVGSDEARLAMSLAAPMPVGPLRVVGHGRRTVETLVTEWSIDAREALMSGWTAETLAAHLSATTDPVEGYWSYLDRRTDDDRARLGGKYRLAIVRSDASGCYDLLYMGGAVTGADRWLPLMVKGRLVPSRFELMWQLTWYDAVAVALDDDEAYATLSTAEGVLTLEFPIYRSRLRFAKD